jgi:hypothetical protein
VEKDVQNGGESSMNERNESHARLWIRERDTDGNTVDHRLVAAAYRVWERARLIVIRYLAEDTEAPEILETSVDRASRAMMGNHQAIESFDTYLLRSVARETVRRLRKKRRIRYVNGADLERLAGAVSVNLDGRLDDARRIELFRACMDEQGRTMFDLRVLNYKWRTIASLTGYADGHSARVVFRKKMGRALERFRGLL